MKKLNVWIHCRVTNESERVLLTYQEEKIKEYLDNTDTKVIGVSKEVNAGRDSHTRALDAIRTYARRGEIDAVIVTDKTRLLAIDEQYQEFKLFCNMSNVQVIDLQDLELLYKSFLLNL